MQTNSIEEIIADLRRGKMVIVTDDAARENEGDLIAAAELATPETVNFMTKFGRGRICVPITRDAAIRLDLPPMVSRNADSFKTDYTVTVDAAEDISTGISTFDRAKTISVLADPRATGDDLVRPGHVDPIVAKPGGVLRRAGHTEAAVDLARMAGLEPAGVICEIMNDDGTMARMPDLLNFAAEHDLKICTIEALIQYRRNREQLVEKEEVIKMPTDFGEFDLHLYRSLLDGENHLALVLGAIDPDKPTLVRVHSECLTGDVFGSRRCDCGGQLH
ncbi:MAG: 3,4-dihydroxy-2-butanone-4-phosphate synthase, partial [Planctomycetota bacterium]